MDAELFLRSANTHTFDQKHTIEIPDKSKEFNRKKANFYQKKKDWLIKMVFIFKLVIAPI